MSDIKKKLDTKEEYCFKKGLLLVLIIVGIAVFFYVYWNEMSTFVSNMNEVESKLFDFALCTIRMVAGTYTCVVLAEIHCLRDIEPNTCQIELARIKRSVKFFNFYMLFLAVCVLIFIITIAYSFKNCC